MLRTLAFKWPVVLAGFALMAGLVSLPSAAQQVGQTAAAPAQATSSRDLVRLTFRDVEISEVIGAFSSTLGRPFLLDPRVKGKITLESPRPVTVDEAYSLLASALGLQGFSLAESDGVVRVLPTADAKSLVPEVYRGSDQAGLVTRVFKLKHQDVVQVAAAVRAIVPAASPLTVLAKSNSIVVTDTRENLDRIADVIARVDKVEESNFRTVDLQHAYAADVAATLDRVINGAGSQPGQEFTKVVLLPDSRTNRLLIRSADPRRVEQALQLAIELDTPLARPSNVNVVYLKNAEASKLAVTLNSLFKAAAGQGASLGNFSATPTSTTATPATGQAPTGAALANSLRRNPNTTLSNNSGTSTGLGLGEAEPTLSGASGNVQTESGAVIQADPTQNALLVVAPPPLFRQIRAVIDQLDQRPAQVFIESLIVEISADQAAEFGVQFQYLNGLNLNSTQGIGGTNFTARGQGSNLLDLAANPLSAGAGLNVGVIRGTVNFGGATIANLGLLARALQTSGNGNIIATPNLLTLDNEEAKIVIGQNVPFITGSFTTTANTSNNPFQTIERRDVGTTLRVKPLITEGGAIRMQIFQEVSSVSQRLAEGIITNKRAIESTVMVEDQQIIVLGGLIQDETNNSVSKVPLLGDIPLVGNLFKYDSRSRSKTNLYVFLRPVVVRNAQDTNLLTQSRYQSIRATAEKLVVEEPYSLLLPSYGKGTLPESATDLGPQIGEQTVPPKYPNLRKD